MCAEETKRQRRTANKSDHACISTLAVCEANASIVVLRDGGVAALLAILALLTRNGPLSPNVLAICT